MDVIPRSSWNYSKTNLQLHNDKESQFKLLTLGPHVCFGVFSHQQQNHQKQSTGTIQTA